MTSLGLSSSGIVLLMAMLLPLCLTEAQAQSGRATIEWDDALDQEPPWYGSAEALRIADNVLLYQHENGGWPKNIDMARVLREADRDRIRAEQAQGGTTLSNTTLDNGATYRQMRYLARVYEATGHERFKEGVLRGLDYLLEAQYDNGGWPQYYPLREGYYDRITFNDGATIGALRVLRDVAAGAPPFAFVDAGRRAEAEAAVDRGIDLILRTQIRQNGRLAAWSAQYDEETLEPAWARDYEPPSLSGSESVGIVRFLMSIEEPTPEIVAAVEGAAEWFRDVAIHGYRYEEFVDAEGREDRRIVRDPEAGPLWARFYELVTNRPLFLGRDSVFRYSLSEIERERRAGYRYYGGWAEALLEEEYPAWRSRHDLPEWGALDGRRHRVAAEDGSIRPYRENPWYWQYRGEPILLRGGSGDDNLFQWTGERLTDHLDLLVSAGGNYLRNTMSDRDEGNIYAFEQIEDGLYDLDRWNDEYWDRLTFFLDETARRGIIVQLTLWDQFDLGNSEHPWFSANNVDLADGVIDSREDFYSTVEANNEEGLRYQNAFVDKLLSITLSHDHVLYNINNESSEGAVWENYWARYIKQAAEDRGREAYVTTMQFDPSNSVRHVMTFRDLYDFIEISQNNQDSRGGRGQGHWDNILYWREKLVSHPAGPMPMNNVKVYGAKDGVNYSAGTESEAIDRFWRNILAGCASSRFHRPAEPHAWGAGLNERVQTNLKAMSMLLEELDIFSCSPHNDLLSHRVPVGSTMEAYATASIGRQYAVYFPPGRYTVDLDPWVYVDRLRVRWLDIDRLSWSDPEIVEVQWEGGRNDWGDRGRVSLTTPSNRPYVVLLEAVE